MAGGEEEGLKKPNSITSYHAIEQSCAKFLLKGGYNSVSTTMEWKMAELTNPIQVSNITTDRLIKQNTNYWKKQSKDDRQYYLQQIDLSYHAIVDEFFEQADYEASNYNTVQKKHVIWRQRMAVLTGILAILNVILASTTGEGILADFPIIGYLPLLAAVYAATLAILHNLESNMHYLERAQTHREVRDLFLNAAREWEKQWHLYVRPFMDSANACVNAASLYNGIIQADALIRAKTKELKEGSKQGPKLPDSKTGN